MDQRENRFYREPQPSAHQAEQAAEEARGVDAAATMREAMDFRAWWNGYRDPNIGHVEDSIRRRAAWDAWHARALLAAPAAADARTQSGAHGLAPIHIGNLTTLNQDTYPGLGDWWVQLRIGSDFDEVLARVYGKSPEQARERAAILARAASESRAEERRELSDAAIEQGWHQTFSTNNPYCPCNLKSFTKAVRWAERALSAQKKQST